MTLDGTTNDSIHTTPEPTNRMWGRIRSTSSQGRTSALDRADAPPVEQHIAPHVLSVDLPLPYDAQSLAGLFFLIRSGVSNPKMRFSAWDHYLPVTAYAMQCGPGAAHIAETGLSSTWQLALHPGPTPADSDSLEWLLDRNSEDSILISGPYGNRFLPPDLHTRRNLLLVVESNRFLPLISLIHTYLDAGGRVTLLRLPSPHQELTPAALATLIPLQVEIQTISGFKDAAFTQAVRWADTLVAGLSQTNYSDLAYAVRRARFQFGNRRGGGVSRPQDEFAHVLTSPDYLCGYGACLACTLPTAGGGVTRACVHGPILPLSTLAAD